MAKVIDWTTLEPLELRKWRIKTLRKRDGYFCFHPDCRKPFTDDSEITFDHWIPQSRGGTWDIKNLRLMHKRCNAIKSDDMPNPDGTLPPKKRALSALEARRAQVRPEVCETCMSGRILLIGEQCPVCGSGPMPAALPQTQKKRSQDCDHNTYWCWACIIGIYERPAAIMQVLDAEGSLD